MLNYHFFGVVSPFKPLFLNNLLPFAVWGGDPVYPTINYIQDPDEEIDYRGPDFHEPTPNMLDYLKEVYSNINFFPLNRVNVQIYFISSHRQTQEGMIYFRLGVHALV